jgi:hypothetical protein
MGFNRRLIDVSELSKFPEDNQNSAASDDASMSTPSFDDIPGVDLLNINSAVKAQTRHPLERRSKVLAREAEAEAQAASEKPEAEPTTSGPTPPSVSPQSGNAGKRRQPESSAGASPVDVAMVGRTLTRTRLRWRWSRGCPLPSAEGAVRRSRASSRMWLYPRRSGMAVGVVRGACYVRGRLPPRVVHAAKLTHSSRAGAHGKSWRCR